jgi:LuxR family maltose regulon positive regulatory protein
MLTLTTLGTERQASRFTLLDSKLRPPVERPGTVARTGLVDRIRDGRRHPVVVIEAPAGYGKTTLASSWARADNRRCGWYTIDEGDNAPALFLAYLAAALEHCGAPVDKIRRRLESPRANLSGVATALARAFAGVEEPAVLVLDNVCMLTHPACLAAVGAVVDAVPPRSQVALLTRTPLEIPRAEEQPDGGILRLETVNLRLTDGEAAAVLAGTDLAVGEEDASALNAACEGWVAGVYLVGLAGEPAREHLLAEPRAGVDRFIADYFRLELLGRRNAAEQAFLLDISVLDRMCGDLCDAMLGRPGSGDTLAGLERSNLFLVPLDRNNEWYRLHPLFRDMLRAELEARNPGRAQILLDRATTWHEERGEIDLAIECAITAGDTPRAAQLISAVALQAYWDGRAVTLHRWFRAVDDPHVLASQLQLATLGAGFFAVMGEARLAERWAQAAYQGAPDAIMLDGARGEAWIATIRSLRAADDAGAAAMVHDAEEALAGLPPGSPFEAVACLGLGFGYRMLGDDDRATGELGRAADYAIRDGASAITAMTLAELSLIAAGRNDVETADTLARRAVAAVDAAGIDDYAAAALARAARARASLMRGWRAAALADLVAADRIAANTPSSYLWLAVTILLELAHLHLAFDDPGRASELLDQIADISSDSADLGALGARVDRLRHDIDVGRSRDDGWASVLTAAELRLLPLLASHLSFREISQRLGISRNTVKTQAIAVYRKLEVSSRSEAVRTARERGLLRPDAADSDRTA